MQAIKIKVSRIQAWRMKLGVHLINLGVKVCGKANQSLLKRTVDQFNSNK